MKWKLIIVGGLIFWLATFVVSFATGPIIHGGVLKETYKATASFWRPELQQEPPDMAALMPLWITTGILSGFVLAAIYSWISPAWSGAGWRKGLNFGLLLAVMGALFCLGWSTVFNLPAKVWIWWAAEGFVYNLVGGAVLGWFADLAWTRGSSA